MQEKTVDQLLQEINSIEGFEVYFRRLGDKEFTQMFEELFEKAKAKIQKKTIFLGACSSINFLNKDILERSILYQWQEVKFTSEENKTILKTILQCCNVGHMIPKILPILNELNNSDLIYIFKQLVNSKYEFNIEYKIDILDLFKNPQRRLGSNQIQEILISFINSKQFSKNNESNSLKIIDKIMEIGQYLNIQEKAEIFNLIYATTEIDNIKEKMIELSQSMQESNVTMAFLPIIREGKNFTIPSESSLNNWKASFLNNLKAEVLSKMISNSSDVMVDKIIEAANKLNGEDKQKVLFKILKRKLNQSFDEMNKHLESYSRNYNNFGSDSKLSLEKYFKNIDEIKQRAIDDSEISQVNQIIVEELKYKLSKHHMFKSDLLLHASRYSHNNKLLQNFILDNLSSECITTKAVVLKNILADVNIDNSIFNKILERLEYPSNDLIKNLVSYTQLSIHNKITILHLMKHKQKDEFFEDTINKLIDEHVIEEIKNIKELSSAQKAEMFQIIYRHINNDNIKEKIIEASGSLNISDETKIFLEATNRNPSEKAKLTMIEKIKNCKPLYEYTDQYDVLSKIAKDQYTVLWRIANYSDNSDEIKEKIVEATDKLNSLDRKEIFLELTNRNPPEKAKLTMIEKIKNCEHKYKVLWGIARYQNNTDAIKKKIIEAANSLNAIEKEGILCQVAGYQNNTYVIKEKIIEAANSFKDEYQKAKLTFMVQPIKANLENLFFAAYNISKDKKEFEDKLIFLMQPLDVEKAYNTIHLFVQKEKNTEEKLKLTPEIEHRIKSTPEFSNIADKILHYFIKAITLGLVTTEKFAKKKFTDAIKSITVNVQGRS